MLKVTSLIAALILLTTTQFAFSETIVSEKAELAETRLMYWVVKHEPGYDYRIKVDHISGTPVSVYTLSKEQHTEAERLGFSCLYTSECDYLLSLSDENIQDRVDTGWTTAGDVTGQQALIPNHLRSAKKYYNNGGISKWFYKVELDAQYMYFIAIADNIEDGRWTSANFTIEIERRKQLFGREYREG